MRSENIYYQNLTTFLLNLCWKINRDKNDKEKKLLRYLQSWVSHGPKQIFVRIFGN